MIDNAAIRALGYEPTRRGWRPLNADVVRRLDEADERRHMPSPGPKAIRIEGGVQPCIVCERDSEPSLVGTPVCSALCTAVLSAWTFDAIEDSLRTKVQPDGTITGGTEIPVQPPKARPFRPIPAGAASVEHAVERLGDCQTVLERHGIQVRGKKARCPFHPDDTPSLSVYERNGKSRWHCFGCDMGGDVIDLEAQLEDEPTGDTIRRWGR